MGMQLQTMDDGARLRKVVATTRFLFFLVYPICPSMRSPPIFVGWLPPHRTKLDRM